MAAQFSRCERPLSLAEKPQMDGGLFEERASWSAFLRVFGAKLRPKRLEAPDWTTLSASQIQMSSAHDGSSGSPAQLSAAAVRWGAHD